VTTNKKQRSSFDRSILVLRRGLKKSSTVSAEATKWTSLSVLQSTPSSVYGWLSVSCGRPTFQKRRSWCSKASSIDVGADKGIILSEKGLSGCFACAKRTNIELSSLSELRETHQEVIHHAFVDSMLTVIERATSKARKLAPWSFTSKFPVELIGRISIFEDAMRRYRDGDGRLPVFIGVEDDGNTRILANSQDDIIKAHQGLLDRINNLIAELEASPDKR
jgi:hypothetical protein